MEHVNKRERFINIFQGVGMQNPIMLDQENTDLDSVMNQSSIQRSYIDTNTSIDIGK